MHNYFAGHKVLIICLALAGLLLALVFFEVAWLKLNGTPVPRPDIPRGPLTQGQGKKLTYVIMGDSTAVSQGSDYADGYASASASYLSSTYTVTWSNYAVSGARAKDVVDKQLPDALAQKPDLVLIAVGANDVTHVTGIQSVKADLAKAITRLKAANPSVRIILTGSPDMGAPHRLPQPLRALAGKRTVSLNNELKQLADNKQIFFAPIAEKTGSVFRKHPELFAADNFHPNTAGYALWSSVIIDTMGKLENSSH